jgi:PAS domain-containing protein
LDALKLPQEKDPDLSFILRTGQVGEEVAVEAMKAGAHDYILKSNPARLIPAVERQLCDTKARRENRQTEKALRESRERYRLIVETANEGIWQLDEENRTTFVNQRMAEMFDRHKKELQPFIDHRRTKVIADLIIIDTQIAAYSGNNVNVFLDVTIKARFKSFVINDDSYKVLDGSRSRIVNANYMARMVRKRGVQTRKPIEVIQCPNCGADIDINNLGRCEHCGGELTMEQYDWTLAGVSVQK